MNYFDKWFNKVFTYSFFITWIIITILVYFIWIGLEYVFDGQIISQYSDSIICLIFTHSLTYNLIDIFIKGE